MVALLALYEKTGAAWAGDGYAQLHQWARTHHTNPTTGLWHSTADRRGRPTTDRQPMDLYHYPRMLMLNLESVERQLTDLPER